MEKIYKDLYMINKRIYEKNKKNIIIVERHGIEGDRNKCEKKGNDKM